MNEYQNYFVIIFYVFIVTIGVIFFLNITMRYRRSINKIDIFLIIAVISVSALYISSILTFNSNYADTRNVQRSNDIEVISAAMQEYVRNYPFKINELGSIPKCPEANFIGSKSGYVNLYEKLQDISLPVLPTDPTNGTNTNSGYTVCVTSTSRIIVSAPYAENGKVILVKK